MTTIDLIVIIISSLCVVVLVLALTLIVLAVWTMWTEFRRGVLIYADDCDPSELDEPWQCGGCKRVFDGSTGIESPDAHFEYHHRNRIIGLDDLI